MIVSEMADGERGRIGPWDLWRSPAGEWFVNGRAQLQTAQLRISAPVERRGGMFLVEVEAVPDYGFYGFADKEELLGSDVESLPCVVSAEVDAVVAAARGRFR
jgi:hypothetical protein